jgi:VanZ family protein
VTSQTRTALNLGLQTAAWLALAVIAWVTLGPLELRPDISSAHPHFERGLSFLALSFLFVWAYPQRPFAVAALVVFGAVALELFQLLTPHRHGALGDLAVKLAGALIGLPVGVWTRRCID